MRAAVAESSRDLMEPDLHHRLQAIVDRLRECQHRFERARDSRAIFSYIYATITHDVDHQMERLGLVDPGWIVTLAEAFADRYFAAIDAFETGQPVSPAWRAVFEALDGRSSVLEDAVFPMTVHIVHDLPLALIDVGFGSRSSGRHLHDFDRINKVMETSMDKIRRGVTRRYSPGLRFLDRMERHYDVVLSDYGIRMSRSQAWYDALRLCDPTSREPALRSLEERPIELVRSVRHPADSWIGPLLSLLRGFARLFRRWPEARRRSDAGRRQRPDPRPGSPG
jgi:hypothetical protein